MENIEYQEEIPLESEETKEVIKLKKFKRYLAQSGCLKHFVRFMLGVRNKQQSEDSVSSQDVLKMYRQYIGTLNEDNSTLESLKKQINQEKQIGNQLKSDIQQIITKISEKKQSLQKIAQEKRLREQEQANNPKKGGKK